QFSIMMGIATSVITIFLGLILHGLLRFRLGKFILSTLAIFGLFFLVNQVWMTDEADTSYVEDADSPSIAAPYDVDFFTYGSGSDIQRKEYGADVDILTDSVDASHFITKWSSDRRKFWDFGPENFPINGRVFMPEGEGPFPVFFMVHGNHTMEYFSTDGYDYLGELLAARGFIFVSVDEDFVNYSNHLGSPNDNYLLRTWLMLKHIVAINEMNETAGHPLEGKVDMDRVAVGGHSRGGQAAAMAANYKAFFPDDEEILEEMLEIDIDAVIALSPTDKLVDDKRANLIDTNYMVIHGAQDADVYSFRGDFQYGRTDIRGADDLMKATLYVQDANHVQFNTSWGMHDLSEPRGLYLNQKDLLSKTDQQQVSKAYIAAFLEKVFHDDDRYEALFTQEAHTKDWLPDTTIVSKYVPSHYQAILTYDELPDYEPFAEAKHTEITRPVNRSGKSYARKALEVTFNEDVTESLALQAGHFFNSHGQQAGHLVLTVANASPGQEVELETTVTINGEDQTDQRPLSPVIEIDTTLFGWFDKLFRDGKYEKKWDPQFETIHIPLDKIDLSELDEAILDITFKTEGEGKILFQEIGVY
ncbi:MAG TPA: hypothetical protein VK075_02795, partial [Pseudogracilibacillus sp.]|nr:hypothetical protein [Pseudogracilibacillus sp.]